RPPANGVLDQAHGPTLAHKRDRVVLASAIDRDDFRRRGMKDSEQTKESRYDCRLVQNWDHERNIVKLFAFTEHWPPLYASTSSPTELDVAGKPNLFRFPTGNRAMMRPAGGRSSLCI